MNWILATLQASIAFFDAWMSQLYDVVMLGSHIVSKWNDMGSCQQNL